MIMEASHQKILVVDDGLTIRTQVNGLLRERGFEVILAEDRSECLKMLEEEKPGIILLDITMPETDGIELCRTIKADDRYKDIPVLALTTATEMENNMKGRVAGADDCLTKPFLMEELMLRVDSLLQSKGVLEQLKQEIRLRRQAEQHLLHEAFHDKLTGLPNRALFLDRLEQTIRRAKRHQESLFAVILVDFDRFRVVNESLGPEAGDQLLVAMARRLRRWLRAGDTVARLGGDEFTMLIHEISDVSDTIRVAKRVQREVAVPLILYGHEVVTSASIGIVVGGPGYDKPQDILRDADMALHRAKTRGKACYQVFDKAMHERAVSRLKLENDLRRAVERQEFQIHYQPIISLKVGRIIGLEALVRWQHPRRGMVSPMEFVPLAEETGMIVPIGLWVLREACRQMGDWLTQFGTDEPLSVNVNLSSRQFSQPDLVEQIDQIFRDRRLEAGNLILEITESVVMERAESAAAILAQLKDLGVRLSIDDFGTGYSSLSYLHTFPIDSLKIDRSFIGKMSLDSRNMEIVRTIMVLARNLGMDVTAEGIETADQLAQLRALECEYGQGYFFSKPLDGEAITRLLASKPHW